MKIKKIQLKNGYKRFYDLTIDLGDDPKRIIALVGPNGCGKSSVFDGMLFVNNAHNALGDWGPKNFKFHSMNAISNYDHNNIIIEFDEGNFREVRRERIDSGKQNTIFSFRSSYRYNSDLRVTQTTALPEIKTNNYGASSSIDIDGKMDQNYRRLQIKYNDYLNDNDCKPTEAKHKIIGDLNNTISNCINLKIDNLGDIQSDRGSIYFKKNDHPRVFDYNVLSSGEKEVVDILLDLYLRQDVFNETIYLIDEPELHINTAIQKNLLIEINKLIPDNCQIWIATNSIGFLRGLQEELKNDCDVIEFKQDCSFASTAYTLKPMKKTLFSWKEIFKTALDDLTGLLSPKRIIYCEGKDRPGSDGVETGFDAKVYNNIFSEKYYDTLFVSSGGNTELDQRSEIALAVLSKVLSDIEILVLKDRDVSSGKLNTEKDRQLYLKNNSNNHRLLKRWEIENYLFDKEVLKKYCAENTLIFDEESYDSFVTDIVNQNIKDEIGRIKNFCNITTSINAEIFKLNLSKLITDDMIIYSELEDCIFERK